MTMDTAGLQAILERHRPQYSNPYRSYCDADSQPWPCDFVTLARQMLALAEGMEALRATLDRALPPLPDGLPDEPDPWLEQLIAACVPLPDGWERVTVVDTSD